MAAKLWCVTAICLSAASKWALAILISRCQKCVIVSGSGIRFTSALLPPYLKRARSVEELLPRLYLKGISTGTTKKPWQPCSVRMPKVCQLTPFPGSRNAGLMSTESGDSATWATSATCTFGLTVFTAMSASMTACACWWWWAWQSMAARSWLPLRKAIASLKPAGLSCWMAWLRVGLRPAQSWQQLTAHWTCWKALSKVYPQTKQQRCWVHKTANVLNKSAQSSTAQSKRSTAWYLDGWDAW